MVPTSFSQIVEQILNAVVSILAAFLLIKAVAGKGYHHAGCIRRFGKRHRYRGRRTYRTAVHVWGYSFSTEIYQSETKRDRSSQLLTTGEVYKIIITMVTPVILSTFIYNCNTSLNLTIYTRIMEHVKGFQRGGGLYPVRPVQR